jgi:hypothetical protein
VLPGNGEVDVDAELAGKDRGAEFGGEFGTAQWIGSTDNEVVSAGSDKMERTKPATAVPGAVELLAGVSVYREPVDVNALLFQVGTPRRRPRIRSRPGSTN